MIDTILIVDDNPLNHDVFSEALGHAWILKAANCIDDAFELILEEKISLIILDVVLNDITAFDFIVRLSQVENGLDIPVVFLTSMEERGEMHHAMKLGGTDYIFKPLDIQEIQMTVRNQMRLLELKKI